ncbi:pseudouridine synthase [Peptoniphilus indolicus]|uniref:Pseudouridine synthase n=1 Tax=Peptoniphilus indolicus TaxID=33030 RepID=A0A379DDJ4_9FIRM|nr:pseudouridine synthase [Peptoniphilus indolicus]SUB76058.1 Ribosomal large subunit pseudouridine synthase B [Peptoniphilus indolicus]
MRLQKFMAHSGVASRRKCEELIAQGRVKVNDEVVTEMGKIVTAKDRVYLDSKRLKIIKEHSYYILNKPMGVVSTVSDEKKRITVVDLIESSERLYPVGRLDIDTTGLLILTDDGELTNKLMHPSNVVEKTYIATVEGTPNKTELDMLRVGIKVGKEKFSPAKVKVLKRFESDSILEIKIHEGKNHEVKIMCEKIGHPVKKLKRIKIGNLELGDLRIGNYRRLEEDEVKCLKELMKC